MTRTARYLSFLTFFPVFCLSIFLGPVRGETEAGAKAPQYNTSSLSVRLDGGLFTVRADNVPFEKVLDELSRKGAAEFKMDDASLSTDPVTVSFAGQAFPEAISMVLKNYSYILEYRGDNCPRVIILALKGPREGQSPQVIFHEPPKAADDHDKEKKQPVVNLVKAPTPDPYGCEMPSSSGEALSTDGMHEAGLSREERNANVNAILDWAQKILPMKQCSSLWSRAVEQLAGIQDSLALSLLAGIAKNGETPELRELATRALWKNTAKSEFMNIEGITALTALSSSSDPGPSAVAQQAISDFKSYMDRVNVGDVKSTQDIDSLPH